MFSWAERITNTRVEEWKDNIETGGADYSTDLSLALLLGVRCLMCALDMSMLLSYPFQTSLRELWMCHVNRWPWTWIQQFCLGQPPHEFYHHILPQTVILSGNTWRKIVKLPQMLHILEQTSHRRVGSKMFCILCPIEQWIAWGDSQNTGLIFKHGTYQTCFFL